MRTECLTDEDIAYQLKTLQTEKNRRKELKKAEEKKKYDLWAEEFKKQFTLEDGEFNFKLITCLVGKHTMGRYHDSCDDNNPWRGYPDDQKDYICQRCRLISFLNGDLENVRINFEVLQW